MILNNIIVPASKSYLQRALAIAALARGESVLENVSYCNDVNAAIKIIESLGVEVVKDEGFIKINSKHLEVKQQEYSAGEAGLGIRMFSPFLAMSNKVLTFNGQGSLLKRPMQSIVDALKQLSVKVESNNGFLPLLIQGPMQAGVIEIDGSLSSQLLTGLLITLPLLDKDSIIKVKKLKSKPYIDMTLDILKDFSVFVEHDNYETFKVNGKQSYNAGNYRIEGDWSSASFFLVLAAVKGEVQFFNLDLNSKQADKAILEVLEQVGAEIEFQNETFSVRPGTLNAFKFNASHCPDLFPPLVVLATQCEGMSKIKGVQRLIHKESNRAKVLKNEFEKIGVEIKLKGDEMKIFPSTIKPGIIDSNNDHRIAMAAGIMNQFTSEDIQVHNKEAINKSYPEFFTELYKLNF